jgi:hypothetical protein
MHAVTVSILVASLLLFQGSRDPADLAKTWVEAVADLNDAHARKPAGETEADMAKKLPKPALAALDALLASESKDAPKALVQCAESALDLDRVDDFERVRARLDKTSPDDAKKIGIVLSRPRFLMRGLDGVEIEGLKAVADALDQILLAYDEVFGFAEWSKVPGKKLRIRVHLVAKLKDPPHFAPQFPWHSEIDFPVIDAKAFSSPTSDGKMQFFGLCHELGHVIAMWGDRNNQEDHHAWADYTGFVIVEHLAAKKNEPALENLKDARWRTLAIERKKLQDKKVEPGTKDWDTVFALFVALHDTVGPKAIGEAINALDAKDDRLRINHVRYYGLDAFGKALLATSAGKKKAKDLRAILP